MSAHASVVGMMRLFWGSSCGAGLLATMLYVAPPVQMAQVRNSQVQVARQFLLAVGAGDWVTAYGWLAPEVREQLSARQFRKAALPLYQQARQYGPAISLYKLGYRLRETQATQPFVAFSFKADTLQASPHFQLDVSFRDSTARTVLGFALVPLTPVK